MEHLFPDQLRIDAAFVMRRAAKMTPAEHREVLDKRGEIEALFDEQPLLAPHAEEARAMLQMLDDAAAFRFTDLHYDDLAIAVFAMHYVVSPVDIIPDSVEEIGYADDAAVTEQAALLLGHVLQRYRAATA